MSETASTADRQADVIVVGAGPAGSAAAYHLANAGLDVLLLEKTAFPREKVCGDGLTPRGTKQLINMGIDISEEAGWIRNYGLRIQGAGHVLQLDWPDLSSHPNYGLTRNRMDFDDMLARQAVKAGARLRERTNVTAPILDDRGFIVGVTAKPVDDNGRRAGGDLEFRAPLVMAADGNSSRLSIAMGLHKRDDRPMGVAVRTYFTSPRADDYLQSWLELGADDPKQPGQKVLLPGYGWIFGMGDGTVNVGLGILNTSEAFGSTDYRALMRSWLDGTPEEWGFREHNATGKIGGAALPMGFNRTPHYASGLLLVGDAGGMVNPFNGEGIGYAMESAKLAAEVVVQALARAEGPAREKALAGYPLALKQALGSYYRLGNIFSRLIGNPLVMRTATKYGLPRTTLMKLVLKLLAGLYDPKDGDAFDRMIMAATRMAPSV